MQSNDIAGPELQGCPFKPRLINLQIQLSTCVLKRFVWVYKEGGQAVQIRIHTIALYLSPQNPTIVPYGFCKTLGDKLSKHAQAQQINAALVQLAKGELSIHQAIIRAPVRCCLDVDWSSYWFSRRCQADSHCSICNFLLFLLCSVAYYNSRRRYFTRLRISTPARAVARLVWTEYSYPSILQQTLVKISSSSSLSIRLRIHDASIFLPRRGCMVCLTYCKLGTRKESNMPRDEWTIVPCLMSCIFDLCPWTSSKIVCVARSGNVEALNSL